MKYLVLFIVLFIGYGVVGTYEDVEEIKRRADIEIPLRNWEVVRYEGYEYGSFKNHGGKVWYHVKDKGHSNTYYRVYVTLWGGELHYAYGAPEVLNRINLDQ